MANRMPRIAEASARRYTFPCTEVANISRVRTTCEEKADSGARSEGVGAIVKAQMEGTSLTIWVEAEISFGDAARDTVHVHLAQHGKKVDVGMVTRVK